MATNQFSDPNKVYIVTTAITGDVTVGNGSSLVFQGGKISNGKITGSNVTLRFDSISPTFSNVTFSGTFNCECFYPELFGAKGDGKSDDAGAIQACIDAAHAAGVFVVHFLPKTYLITSTIFLKSNIRLEGSVSSNLYRYKDKPKILANLLNPDAFAFDTDVFEPSNVSLNKSRVVSLSNSGRRFDIYHKIKNSVTPLYNPTYPSEYYYGGPFYISNLAINTTNDTFGAIREIGMTNACISGVLIDGFKLGMYLAKGWNFIVERVAIRVSMFGLVLGAEITDGLFNSVQICCNNVKGKNTGSATKFFTAMTVPMDDYTKVFGDSVARSTGIIADQTSATFNSCSLERFQVGLIGYSLKLVFNSPYIEDNKDNLIFVAKGTIHLNNSAGSQKVTSKYSYVATNIQSKIILNNAHPGTYYPGVAEEDYNKGYYNAKSYIVTNHNKVYYRLTYSASSFVDCNVGDTLFVCDTHPNASKNPDETALMPKNLGNYYLHPITLKDALQRVATDSNYRDVRRIVLVGDVTLGESLTWQCDHPLTVERDRKAKRLTINAKQNIACDVTFKNLNIALNTPLCQTQQKDSVNLAFEATAITGSACIVDNTAQQEAPCAAVYMTLDKQSTFATGKYFSNDAARKQATSYHVMVAGKQVAAISGATAARPPEALYTGYCYFDSVLNKPIWWNGKNWVDSLGNSADSSRFK